MFFVAASVVVSVLCMWAAARRVWLLRGRPESIEALARALRRADRKTAADAIGAAEIADVIQEVLEAPTEAHGRARLDEHLADVARELDVGSEIPRSAARIALASGTALAVIAVARLGPDLAANRMAGPLVAFAAGIVGAVGAAMAGRLAEGRAQRLRVAYDAVARSLERILSGRRLDNMQVDPTR